MVYSRCSPRYFFKFGGFLKRIFLKVFDEMVFNDNLIQRYPLSTLSATITTILQLLSVQPYPVFYLSFVSLLIVAPMIMLEQPVNIPAYGK